MGRFIASHEEFVARAHAHQTCDTGMLLAMLDPKRGGGFVSSILEALGDIGDPNALEAFFAYLEVDRRIGIQACGWKALGGFDDPSVLPAIRRVLARRDEYARYGAVEALGRIGGPEAVDALRLVLDDNRGMRMKAVSALARIGTDEAVEVLAQLMRDREPSVRNRASDVLLWVGTPGAISALTQALPSLRPLWRRWLMTWQVRAAGSRPT